VLGESRQIDHIEEALMLKNQEKLLEKLPEFDEMLSEIHAPR
jgi:hypothetical protein